jgi:hypothetical protein
MFQNMLNVMRERDNRCGPPAAKSGVSGFTILFSPMSGGGTFGRMEEGSFFRQHEFLE